MVHTFLFLFLPALLVVSSTADASLTTSTMTPDDGIKDPEERITEIVENSFKYMKHRRPKNDSHPSGRGPVVVDVNLFINSFSSVSVVDMDYSVDILLRQRWVDSRLKIGGNFETLSLGYMKDKLWIPDLFFRNAKQGQLHTLTTPNYLIWLKPDGSLIFSQKLTVKLSCPMQLWNFPLDTQICRLEIGSYGYSMTDLEFRWWGALMSDHVTMSKVLHLNEFSRPTHKTGYCHKSYKTTGQFACIYVEFCLARKFGFYLIYTYLPSVLIIIISWLSFLIDYHAVPARISIGLLSILALMTESAATLQKLPRVSYIKAIDVWLFACLAFVVLSLLEFAFVNTIARRTQKKKLREDLRSIVRHEMSLMRGTTGLSTNSRENSVILKMAASAKDTKAENILKAQRIDRVCMVLFPLIFAAFNICYWFYFNTTGPKLEAASGAKVD